MRSVLLQGYPELEFVIIDGGSTDGSVEIIRRYEPWLAYWVSERDRGQCHAINKGLAKATGVYVGWLNSDDLYLPGALLRAAEAFVQDPEAGVVYGDCDLIDENSALRGCFPAQDFALERYVLGHFVPQQAAFLRRDVFNLVGGMPEDLHYVMEEDLWLRVGARWPMRRIAGSLGAFRICRGTKTSEKPSAFVAEHERVLDRFYARPGLPDAVLAVCALAYGNCNLFGACRAYTAGQIADGQHLLAQALAYHPAWLRAERSALIDSLVGWATYPLVADPQAFLALVFRNLPPSAVALAGGAKAAQARLALVQLAGARRRGDRKAARAWLSRAVRHDPQLLRRRGVLSWALDAWCSPTLARQAHHLARRLAPAQPAEPRKVEA